MAKRIRQTVYATAMLMVCAGVSAQTKNYYVTQVPVDVGMAARGLCVAVDANDTHGIWWWDAGKGGLCTVRQSSIVAADRATVTRAPSGSIDARFRLELIAREPAHLEVALTIVGDTMRGASGTHVPVVRRADLNIPESCCR